MPSPPRSDTLSPRALEVLHEHGFVVSDVEPLTGDVSLRSYFRLTLETGGTAVLASYPRRIASTCSHFARTTELLRTAGVRCPRILATFCDDRLMLLEDLGSRTLYDLRHETWSVLGPWLRRAARLATCIASVPVESLRDLNPALDLRLLTAELDRTWELLLGDDGLLPGSLPRAFAAALGDMLEQLASAPQAACHRDFMARNLVPLEGPDRLVVIDHQDLRVGPRAYDFASLLNDSLFPPADLEMEIAAAVLDAGELADYHRAAVQRTLKAVGTFVGFAQRGNDRHLELVQPTLAHARRHLAYLPEMAALDRPISSLWTEILAAFPG